MKLSIWTGKNHEELDVPDAILRPVMGFLLANRMWDRDLSRLNRLVMNARLDITDWLLQQSQAPARPTVEDAAEAEAILAGAEQEAPSPDAVWDAGGTP